MLWVRARHVACFWFWVASSLCNKASKEFCFYITLLVMAYNKNTYIVEGFTVFGINVCVCVCVVVICFFSLSTHHV
jgi:hypothetical protein